MARPKRKLIGQVTAGNDPIVDVYVMEDSMIRIQDAARPEIFFDLFDGSIPLLTEFLEDAVNEIRRIR